ncbi:MAG: TlpA family protein disulfide reductase [Ignavibacteriae bacterium]|nr:TlpA family protein disulfide reductase [Ignavibacteriota bacterium]
MRKIQILSFLIVAALLFGCGKKEEKKETPKDTPKTETKTENKTSDLKLYKMESVETSKEKNVAPNFTWTENGTKKSLNDYKNKVVFINFWATWCGPCKKEMPDLSKISEELKDKDFVMIGLNVFHQPSAPKVEDFLKANPVSYITIDGNEDLVKAFAAASGNDLSAVPTTFILKDGKFVETIVGGRDKAAFLNLINKYLK